MMQSGVLHRLSDMVIRFQALCLGALFFATVPACAEPPKLAQDGCEPIIYLDNSYTVCEFPASADIRLFWGDVNDRPFMTFTALNTELSNQGEILSFGMNAGMYHADRRPVGLYREMGDQTTGLQKRGNSDNFGMLPNGVFYKTGDQVGVSETMAFEAAGLTPEYASQSGPMLVIDGKLHPKFRADSTSRKTRNGVGVSEDGHKVYFAISEHPVNFHSFATLFKARLGTPNALYFDGVVSRLYDPQNARHDDGPPMGPIVGVVNKQEQSL